MAQNVQIYYFNHSDLRLDPEKVAEIIYESTDAKTRKEKTSERRFAETLKKIRKNYFHLAEPVCFTTDIEVNLIRDVFAESLSVDSPIYKAVDLWRKACIFIATIGAVPEKSIKSLQESGDLYEALLLDASCSVLAEDLALKAQNRWSDEALKKLENRDILYSMRYSPGYCQWDVSGQFALFGYMGGVNLPVSLTKNGMMHPRKSISGLIVLEEIDPASKLSGSCRLCENRCRNIRLLNI